MSLELFFNVQKQGYFKNSCFKQQVFISLPKFKNKQCTPPELNKTGFKKEKKRWIHEQDSHGQQSSCDPNRISKHVKSLCWSAFLLWSESYKPKRKNPHSNSPWVVKLILSISQVYQLQKHKQIVNRGEHVH